MNIEDIVPGMWITYDLLQGHCLRRVSALVVALYPEKVGIAVPYGIGPTWKPMHVTARYLRPLARWGDAHDYC